MWYWSPELWPRWQLPEHAGQGTYARGGGPSDKAIQVLTKHMLGAQAEQRRDKNQSVSLKECIQIRRS